MGSNAEEAKKVFYERFKAYADGQAKDLVKMTIQLSKIAQNIHGQDPELEHLITKLGSLQVAEYDALDDIRSYISKKQL